jgi:4-hydroxybenzoate polyprenyltransferase
MLARLHTYASFVRISHSVFALPFALTGALLAARLTPFTWPRLVWIVGCMVAARNAAMGFNRLVDASFDARKPRTASRELPRGAMTRREATVFVAAWSVAFVLMAAALGPTCLALSPVALGIVFWYSLAKRYTSYTQLFLGLAMAVAPVGGWMAMNGPARIDPWLLGLAIGAWVAGFDVLYACQDYEFDRHAGLHSLPRFCGIGNALWIARSFHLLMLAFLGALLYVFHLGILAAVGMLAVAVLLGYEHSLVREDDLNKMNAAFFTMNGVISVVFFLFVAADLLTR